MVKVVLDDGTIVHTGFTKGPTGSGGQTVREIPVKGGSVIEEVQKNRGGGSSSRRRIKPKGNETIVIPKDSAPRTLTPTEKNLERISQNDPQFALALRQHQQRQARLSQTQTKTNSLLQAQAQKEMNARLNKGNLGPGTYRIQKGGQEFFFTVDTKKQPRLQSKATPKDITKTKAFKPKTSLSPLSFDDLKKAKFLNDTKGMSAVEKRLYVLNLKRKDLLSKPKSVPNAGALILNSGVQVVGGAVFLVRHPIKTAKGLGKMLHLTVTEPKRVINQITNGIIRDPLGAYVEWVALPSAIGKAGSVIVKGSKVSKAGAGASIVYKVAKKSGGTQVKGYAVGKITPAKLRALAYKGKTDITLKSVVTVKKGKSTKTIKKTVKQTVKIPESQKRYLKQKIDEGKKFGTTPKQKRVAAKKKKASDVRAIKKVKSIEKAKKLYDVAQKKLSSVGISNLKPFGKMVKQYGAKNTITRLEKAIKSLNKKGLARLSKTKERFKVDTSKGVKKTTKREKVVILTQKQIEALKDIAKKKKPKRKLTKAENKVLRRKSMSLPLRYDLLSTPMFTKGMLQSELRAAIRTKDSTRYVKAINDLDKLARQVNNASNKSILYQFNDPLLVAVIKLQEKVIDIAASGKTQGTILKIKSAANKIKSQSKAKINTNLSKLSKASNLLSKTKSSFNRAKYQKIIKTSVRGIMVSLLADKVASSVLQSSNHVQGVAQGTIQTTKPMITSGQKVGGATTQIQVPASKQKIGSVPVITSLLVGAGVGAKTYFNKLKPTPVPPKLSGQSGGGFIVPKTFKAKYQTLQKYRYLPDLDSLIFGSKASPYEKAVLTRVGKVFTGLESRKMV